VVALLRRMLPGASIPDNARFTLAESLKKDARLRQLFADGRASGTLLLWLSYFFIFMILVVNSAWSPLLLRSEGVAIEQSALALATFNFGSLFGSGAAGWLLARLGATPLLPLSFVVSALAYGLIGHAASSFATLMTLQAVFGLCAGCASSALIALAAIFYPTPIRAAGVGWAMAAGRCGSILGPLAVRAFVGAHWSAPSIFTALGASVLVGALSAMSLRTHLASTETRALEASSLCRGEGRQE